MKVTHRAALSRKLVGEGYRAALLTDNVRRFIELYSLTVADETAGDGLDASADKNYRA